MKFKIQKVVLAVASFFYTTFNVYAGISDHGRWYSLDDDGGGSISPVSMVIMGVVGIVCASLLIISVLKDEKQNATDKGCLTTFFTVLIAISIYIMMNKCSG